MGPTAGTQSRLVLAANAASDLQDLARVLRQLRRREARCRGGQARTYRELAELTGWSHGIIGDYLTGKVLPPTDRFDALVRLLGAAATELGALATARDRVEERRRRATPSPAGSRPQELPSATPRFVGRAAELAELDTLVAAGPLATTACVISGPAGVGKTTLAVYWGHRVAGQFGGGQLYLDLRGFDPSGAPMPPAEALRRLLTALGTPPQQLPPDLDDATRRYRSLLAGRRVLVVLDNARDAEQARPLLPGAAGCLALVTSRNRLTGLVAGHGAAPVTLGLFGPDESRELLSRQLGRTRLAADPAAAAALITGCAGLPLALSIVGARLATQPDLPLDTLAAQLGAGAHHRLDVLDTTDRRTQLRGVLSWSYRQLGDAPARLLRLLGLHPGTELSAAAATSLSGDPPDRVRAALAELTDTHLLTEPTAGRYVLHDLLYAHAGELAQQVDPADQRRTALHRLLDHYLHTAHSARYQLVHQNPLELAAPRPGVVPEPVTSPAAALAWFDREHRTVLAAAELAAGAGFDRHAWQLAWAIAAYLDRRGQWEPAAAALRTGLAAARRDGDRSGEARVRLSLGYTYIKLRRYPDAGAQLYPALDLTTERGDPTGQAVAHSALNILHDRQDQPLDALAHAEQALRLYQAAGHLPGQAAAHNNLGWSYNLLGDYQQGIVHAERALALLRGLENRSTEAGVWDTLGRAHHQLGNHRRAVYCYRQSAQLHRGCGDRYSEATALTRLGDAHHQAGNLAAARESWRHAGDILRTLGHLDTEQARSRLAPPSGGRPVRDSATPLAAARSC